VSAELTGHLTLPYGSGDKHQGLGVYADRRLGRTALQRAKSFQKDVDPDPPSSIFFFIQAGYDATAGIPGAGPVDQRAFETVTAGIARSSPRIRFYLLIDR